jgi:formate dehydrogenase subunit gamma
MKPGYLLKHEKPTRVFHWVNLIVFVLLLLSGLAVFNKNLAFLAIPFGGLKNAATVHKYLGWVYFIAPLIYIALYPKLFVKFLKVIGTITKDDIAWFKIAGGYLAPFIKGTPPPQDKYNAGQKSLGWMVIGLSCVLAATGLAMFFYASMPPGVVRWAILIHSAVGIFLGCGVIVHAYLAAIHPVSSKEFYTMMGSGYIDEEFAKGHNEKWYKEMKAKAAE